MLDEYKTPDRFWAKAINTACYSINRLYLHRILKKTSYELLTGKNPNVSYFRVFGSKCFILVKRGRKSKFAPKAAEGFLLGYVSGTIIRGTLKAPNSQLVTPISIKLQRPDRYDQVRDQSIRGTRSRLTRA
jgi:hypothetical protein